LVRYSFILVLALLLVISLSNALEPLNLGSGKREGVINLDMGATDPSHKPFMSPTGFVSPAVPQIMALSPSAMVHQARMLRDEAEAMRNEAADILNRTEAVSLEVQKNAKTVSALSEQVRADSSSCTESAISAEARLKETRSIYNSTLDTAQHTSALAERCEALANRTASIATEVESSLNESRQVYDQIVFKAEEVEAMAGRIEAAEGRAKDNADISAYD
jgi:hypothetical protein